MINNSVAAGIKISIEVLMKWLRHEGASHPAHEHVTSLGISLRKAADEIGEAALEGTELPLPMKYAPKNATEILLLTEDRYGNIAWVIGHWACGGGEDQPPFGPGWFYRTPSGFMELYSHDKLCGWLPLPIFPRRQLFRQKESAA